MTATEDVKAMAAALTVARQHMQQTLRQLRQGRAEAAQATLITGVRQTSDALQAQARSSQWRRPKPKPTPTKDAE